MLPDRSGARGGGFTASPMDDRQTDRRLDYERRASVDIALSLAELSAGWGDYHAALRHLDAADELSGGSAASRFRHRRGAWIDAAARNRH